MQHTLVVREVPSLEGRLLYVECNACVLRLSIAASNGKGEIGVRGSPAVELGSIDRGVNFQTNVKVLTCQEVDLIGREDTSYDLSVHTGAQLGDASQPT